MSLPPEEVPQIIQLRGISYQYPGAKIVPDDLSLTIDRGDIYGFLGPNGSGKSTTIKLILGLLRPTLGTMQCFGRNDHREMYCKTGAMVEEPSLYPHLSARKNLLLTAHTRGVSPSRVDEVLDLTGMLPYARQKTGGFSTGMKQRTALALALLHKPELLILDEPGNGLDPPGIVELRNLLLYLNRREGVTIFLSSHQLSEVQKLCTTIGLIKNGKLLYEGSMKDLQAMRQGIMDLRVTVRKNHHKALALLQEHGIKGRVEGDMLLLPVSEEAGIPHIIRLLTESGIDIYSATSPGADLEDIFIRLTGTHS